MSVQRHPLLSLKGFKVGPHHLLFPLVFKKAAAPIRQLVPVIVAVEVQFGLFH